jgi:hypothetical protein
MARFSGASQKRADSSKVFSQVKQKSRLSRGNCWGSAANCEDLGGFVEVFGNVVGRTRLQFRNICTQFESVHVQLGSGRVQFNGMRMQLGSVGMQFNGRRA